MSKTPSEIYGNTNGRQRLRPWLVNKINSGSIKGLEWMDEAKLMFKIPWKHAGKQDYDPEEDSRIFKEWSLHTGKYKPSMTPEPAVWKTRLRTALNKLPDIEEVQDKTQLDIPEPYRVYRLLPRQKKSPPLSQQRSNGHRAYHPYHNRIDTTNQQDRTRMTYNTGGNINQGYPTTMIPYDQLTPPSGNSPNETYYGFQTPISPSFTPPNSAVGLNIDDVNDVISASYMSDLDQMSGGSSPPNMDPETQYQNSNHLTQFNYIQGGIITSVPAITSLQSRAAYGFPNMAFAPQAQGCVPTSAVGMTSPVYSQTPYQAHNAMVPYNGMQAADDMWTASTVPARDDNIIMQTEREMDITIRYRAENVVKERVCNSGCCIYSKSPQPGHEHLTPIELPDSHEVDFKVLKPKEKQMELTNTVIENMFKGLTIEYVQSERSIYVTRYCKGMVFCYSTQFHIGQPPIKLEREKRFKIFDYNKFDYDFTQWYKGDYLQGSRMPIQKPEIFFSVAQKWQPLTSGLEDNSQSSVEDSLVLDDCLVNIIVRPVRANEYIEAVDKNKLSEQVPVGMKIKQPLFSSEEQQVTTDTTSLQFTNDYYTQTYRSYNMYNGTPQVTTNNTHVQQAAITQLS
ncbi:uncharacterized protein LOC117113798 [Anneissia japonica]|uniref:uncharacterized protein LOC117113798 n=1 Tax=Anneissia japonica TaxID=1529436 RepID=UPI001425590A|nr:uncharacterized protein LOC117113798 [Anneissia japonica]XP_033113134.1 uncharacterized protein LOC117113798 [Anneissia japonica]XP_033113140.1 uncharacterized protein LOC117113798 [Anneissia japonica]XP_033113147.1 uncharacterized protein LOC117113798 [Anneissia japonica]